MSIRFCYYETEDIFHPKRYSRNNANKQKSNAGRFGIYKAFGEDRFHHKHKQHLGKCPNNPGNYLKKKMKSLLMISFLLLVCQVHGGNLWSCEHRPQHIRNRWLDNLACIFINLSPDKVNQGVIKVKTFNLSVI